MAGMMKRKFSSETGKYMKGFTPQLIKVITTLPIEYDKQTVLEYYKKYYPNQWTGLINRFDYYQSKDQQLVSVGKKKRYNHKNPQNFFYSLTKVKLICSDGHKLKHKASYCEVARQKATQELENKIKKPKSISTNLQFTDPYHLNVFISTYHKRGVTQHEKIEIVNELKKFRTKETITFFQKLNDSERNSQIRNIAFEHLQSIDAYVRKRKGFKGKKKEYYFYTDKFIVTPTDLAYRLKRDGIQSNKEFDLFISHSCKDTILVKKLISELDTNGFRIYCDWISDHDFLKRKLVSEYTEVVLKERIEQSSKVLFIQTENSVNCSGDIPSYWVKMELEHASKVNKEILSVNTTSLLPLFPEISSLNSECKLDALKIDKLRV